MSTAVSVTWWGHATTTIALAGRRILTDPVLTPRVAHLSRIGGPSPPVEAAAADVAVVSHLHFDHLHAPSLRKLDPMVRIIAPKGSTRALARAAPEISRRVEEVVPGEVVDIGGVVIRVVPAAHDGRRSPLSHYGGPALGFVIEDGIDDPTRVWFAGDTGLFGGMDDLRPVDVAVVPIGGWGPTLGPTHLDPAQAAEAVRRVRAKDAIPIHYGTFWPTGLRRVDPRRFQHLFLEPGARFAAALGTCCPTSTAHLLDAGETTVVAVGDRRERRL
jgi:L-ascorbate metabolism protein UlaG (beta-lactamase superfamily)